MIDSPRPDSAGNHCAGGTAPAEPCAIGTWDHDSSAATACVAWTDCPPGLAVVTDGTKTDDRMCAACANGTFTSADNTATCATWTDCAPGVS
ncbi:hypothetical protein [Labilithrix luteola]|uniref:hypothetical protein n=1 Tax=Labilithrix luteola TaxID=1391654 RepID=UPI00147313F9|nr:hypothetical protein [Labilithrix luteola]